MERRRNYDAKVHEQMKEIVEPLRKRRREMNLTLKEVENATSIRMNYLQALEEGEMDKLISPVYAQGFFKQYASFLGLDGEALVRQCPEIFTKSEAQEFAYGIGTLESRGHPGGGVKWFPNFIWICSFLIVLLTAWYFARYLGVL